MSESEWRFLREAAQFLEEPSFLLRVTEMVGKPAELLLASLPTKMQTAVATATQRALERALDWAVTSLGDAPAEGEPETTESTTLPGGLEAKRHTAAAAVAGAVGGFFGLAGSAVEIPITTTIMLRSIARIAAASGARLSDPRTRLQCLAVFSLGTKPVRTDEPVGELESAYLTSRVGLALALEKTAQWLAGATLAEAGSALARQSVPAIGSLVAQIARRFEAVVSEKFVAQGVPLVGAAGGAMVNAAFTKHFNSIAWYHFGILRLERLHGSEAVEQAYRLVCRELK